MLKQISVILITTVAFFLLQQTDVVAFEFVYQPAKSAYICRGENFSIFISYNGNLISGNWQKNGKDLYVNDTLVSSRFLTIDAVELLDQGEYRYKALAEEEGVELIKYSDKCDLLIPLNVEIASNQQTIYEISAGDNIFINMRVIYGNNVKFQWYMYIDGNKIALTDDYRYSGTNTNALSIKNIDETILTEDIECYYFLEATGECNSVVSEPIYIKEKRVGIELVEVVGYTKDLVGDIYKQIDKIDNMQITWNNTGIIINTRTAKDEFGYEIYKNGALCGYDENGKEIIRPMCAEWDYLASILGYYDPAKKRLRDSLCYLFTVPISETEYYIMSRLDIETAYWDIVIYDRRAGWEWNRIVVRFTTTLIDEFGTPILVKQHSY